VLLLNIFPINKPVPHKSSEVLHELAQAAFFFLRFAISFHLCPRHRMWLG
jgi:hypothetical protein